MPTSPPRHGEKRVEDNRKANQREYNKIRRTGAAFYSSGSWRKVRNRYRKTNPLCVDCKKDGYIVRADVVDHIVPIKAGGESLMLDNLQSLCHMHHNQKTAREQGRAAIYVIVGAPCSGKSTFVNERIKDGGVRVDFDLLSQALGSQSEHTFSDVIKSIVLKARYAAIKEILSGISETAWIIETTPSTKMIQWYKEKGAIFKVIDPGENICLDRAGQRPGGTVERIRGWYHSPPIL